MWFIYPYYHKTAAGNDSCFLGTFISLSFLHAFNNFAFIATTIVLKLINTAPTAGLNTMPTGAKTPAASGIAKMLRSEEHTSELQSRFELVCRLLLEKKKKQTKTNTRHNRH